MAALLVLALPALAATEPPVSFSLAVSNMLRLENLAYEEIQVDKPAVEETQKTEWKRQPDGVRYRQIRAKNDPLMPYVTELWDGQDFYTIYTDFAIKDTRHRPNPPSFPGELSSRWSSNSLQAIPQPALFGEVPCWRYTWECETLVANSVDGHFLPTKATLHRSDFVDQATGYWIGYTLTNQAGQCHRAIRLINLSTNEIPAAHFKPPQPPIRVREETDDYRVYQEEVQLLMQKAGVLKLRNPATYAWFIGLGAGLSIFIIYQLFARKS